MDLADFQQEHGAEALRKLLIKMGSPHRMKNRIETICDQLKKVRHLISI